MIYVTTQVVFSIRYQTLITTLKKVVDASSDDWDDHLSAALYAYRISRQASSKFSPFFLMFNRQPRKAITLAVEEEHNGEFLEMARDESEEEDAEAVMQKLLNIREKCHLKAKENIDAAQQKQKRQYDKKHNALKVYYYRYIAISALTEKDTIMYTSVCVLITGVPRWFKGVAQKHE